MAAMAAVATVTMATMATMAARAIVTTMTMTTIVYQGSGPLPYREYRYNHVITSRLVILVLVKLVGPSW